MTKKILFMPLCSGVAHAGRMLITAQALREQLDGTIEFAGSGRYGALFPEAGFPFHALRDLPETRNSLYERHRSVKRWLAFATAERIHRWKDIKRYVRAVILNELELYKSVKPDLIVWDGRASAPTSAEVAGIPFVSVANTFYTLTPTHFRLSCGFPLTFPLISRNPWLRGLVSHLPQKTQRRLFQYVLILLSRLILRSVNAVRATFDLSAFESPSDAFRRIGPVIVPEPELEPFTSRHYLPENFHYVGPVVWQPQIPIPERLLKLHDVVYVTMGLTGSPRVFKPIVDALSATHRGPVVLTVGDLLDPEGLKPLPENVHVYDFLPGVEMAKRSTLVICHGAMATMAQALSQGVPVIGIPFKVEHEVGIDWVEALGAGSKLHGFDLTPRTLGQMVQQVLTGDEYRQAAKAIASRFCLEDAPRLAAKIILDEV